MASSSRSRTLSNINPLSKGRLLSPLLALCAGLGSAGLASADGGVYQESGGLIVIEIESTAPSGQWLSETNPGGYAFRSFYRWNGQDLFNTPGMGRLRYKFHVTNPGEYFFKLRNRHDDPDDTMENDVWSRMDGGTWYKTFSNGPGTVNQWNWVTKFDFGSQPDASWFLSAGEHELELSARSFDFMMDRFHLSLSGNPDSTNVNVPESIAILGSSFCPPNQNSAGMTAEITVSGSSFFEKQNVRLLATELPQNQFGYFLTSRTGGSGFSPPGSSGVICLTNNVARFNSQIGNSGSSGSFNIVVDTQNIPTNPTSAIMAGDRWHYQAWYRDNGTSNFTRGKIVDFQ